MLQSNKAVYNDKQNIKGLKGSTIAHVLQLKKLLPLSDAEIRDFVNFGIQHIKENAESQIVLTAMTDLFVARESSKVPIINVLSDEIAPFSIKHEPEASLNTIHEQVQFVVQKPIKCISLEKGTVQN